jgi:hypothetical protein
MQGELVLLVFLAPSKIWNLEFENAECRITRTFSTFSTEIFPSLKGEVKKFLRNLGKVWIVGIRLWNAQGNATYQSDLPFPF